MKANEMPERIYLFDYNDAMVTPIEGDTVYVREDAFIEKVVEWIDKNAFRYIVTRKYQGLDVTGLDTSLAADFKKALDDIL